MNTPKLDFHATVTRVSSNAETAAQLIDYLATRKEEEESDNRHLLIDGICCLVNLIAADMRRLNELAEGRRQ